MPYAYIVAQVDVKDAAAYEEYPAQVPATISQYGGDPASITVVGHSAGGHLATMMLACEWPKLGDDLPESLVKNALSISGLYDLEPLRHTPFLKNSLRLTAADALKASPANMPAPMLWEDEWGVLCTVAGGDESAEFLRQNQLILDVWGCEAVPVSEALPGLNHFSVLDALVNPKHRLHQLALQMLKA